MADNRWIATFLESLTLDRMFWPHVTGVALYDDDSQRRLGVLSP